MSWRSRAEDAYEEGGIEAVAALFGESVGRLTCADCARPLCGWTWEVRREDEIVEICARCAHNHIGEPMRQRGQKR